MREGKQRGKLIFFWLSQSSIVHLIVDFLALYIQISVSLRVEIYLPVFSADCIRDTMFYLDVDYLNGVLSTSVVKEKEKPCTL